MRVLFLSDFFPAYEDRMEAIRIMFAANLRTPNEWEIL